VERIKGAIKGLSVSRKVLLVLTLGSFLAFLLSPLAAYFGLITVDTAATIALPSFFVFVICGIALFTSLAVAKRGEMAGLKIRCMMLSSVGAFVGVVGHVRGMPEFAWIGILAVIGGFLGFLYARWRERETGEYY